jgi:hypothetical protein
MPERTLIDPIATTPVKTLVGCLKRHFFLQKQDFIMKRLSATLRDHPDVVGKQGSF